MRWLPFHCAVSLHLLASLCNSEWTAEPEPAEFWETASPRVFKEGTEITEEESQALESTLEFCAILSNATRKKELDVMQKSGERQNQGMGATMKLSQTVILHVRDFYRHPLVAETCLLALRTLVWLDKGQIEGLRKGLPGREPGIRTLLTLANTHASKPRVQEYFFSVLTSLFNGQKGDTDANDFEVKHFLLEPMKKFAQDVYIQVAAILLMQVYIHKRPKIQATVIEEKVVPLVTDLLVRHNNTDLGRSGCLILTELSRLQAEGKPEGKKKKRNLGDEVRKDPALRAAALKVLARQAQSSAPTSLNALLLIQAAKQGFKPLTGGLVRSALITMEAHKMNEKYRDKLAVLVCQVLGLDTPDKAVVEGELHRMTSGMAKDVAWAVAAACGANANLGVWWLTVDFAHTEDDMKPEVAKQMRKLADVNQDGNLTGEEMLSAQSWLTEPEKLMERIGELSWFHQRSAPRQHDEF
eukprot:gnl/MRDRNA2_/MRDRNA2_107969_c0_seq1.p1 gnl/MRDRNA2_/MRDRNA2_107969_c0~~gnl/MRDRNA2_/MRDRNA2_107969_c0_seq1.p1  ORF type:complete len:470 (-),score=93.42 gnl/MRDRNA2_/MRDRNA2_107969_c0_seq1:35-1444(-)